MRLPALPAAVLAAVLAAALLTGCTGSDSGARTAEAFPTPAAERFTAGTCALAAPDVLAVGAAARDLGEGPRVEAAVSGRLREAQERLRDVAETAEPRVKPALDSLVTRIGLVRLAADAERFGPDRTRDLRESYDAVLDVCTTAGSG